MAKIDIGDAATAGLKMIGRRPVSVLVWGLAFAALIAGGVVLCGPDMLTTFSALAHQPAGPPDSGRIMAAAGAMLRLSGTLIAGLLVLTSVVQVAVFRAEFEPQKRAFAYLRLGRAELWVLLVTIVRGVIVGLVQMLLIVGLAMALGLIASGAAAVHDPAQVLRPNVGSLGMRMLGQLIVVVVVTWLRIRLSLATVISYREGRFRLFKSWGLTKGRAWSLFAVLVLVGLMVAALEIVAAVAAMAAFFAFAGHAPDAQVLLSQPAAYWATKFAPQIAGGVVLLAVVIGAGNALVFGALARVYRQLKPDAKTPKAVLLEG